ncbi:MAG: putative 4-hydroxybenzoate polyprenyltransferase [Candidatus Omnitrophica bacterium]|nr:putative 4-hydroxybenzoate polyprenyltransferase [Candidatus Omnitrophota bacterium]
MRIKDLAEALKLEHTIFALPFAYLGLWVAAGGSPEWRVVGWVTLAMVGARTAGMAANRLIDYPIDRMNPRTANWPVPAGRVKRPFLAFLVVVCAGLLFFSASRLNPLCFKLAPLALSVMVLYPFLKRFTWGCHFGLGLVLGAAPIGGWLGVTGRWEWEVLPLSLGVLFWAAGFDILYALLDLDFDRRHSVYSIPQRFGLEKALLFSRLCHVLACVAFGWFGLVTGQGIWFWTGLSAVAGLLLYEHRLVRPARLERINKAFFTVNGWVSVSFFFFTLIGLKF